MNGTHGSTAGSTGTHAAQQAPLARMAARQAPLARMTAQQAPLALPIRTGRRLMSHVDQQQHLHLVA